MASIEIDPTVLNNRREQADAYAAANNKNNWASRIAWISLSEGIPMARKYATKYGTNHVVRKSYQNLVTAGVLIEPCEEYPDGGVFYDNSDEWDSDEGTARWMSTLVDIAAGATMPENFPHA